MEQLIEKLSKIMPMESLEIFLHLLWPFEESQDYM